MKDQDKLDLIGRTLLLIIPSILAVVVIIRAMINARTKGKNATAKLYSEMRRMLEAQAAVKVKSNPMGQTMNVLSFPVKIPKNGDKDIHNSN